MTKIRKKYLEEYLAHNPEAKTSKKKKKQLTRDEEFKQLQERHITRLRAQDRARNRSHW